MQRRAIRNTFRLFAGPNYLFMRKVSGVESDIFNAWAQEFVTETSHLRRGGQHLLLVYENHTGHLDYRELSLLKQNQIVVAGLPAHTSRALQPLDVGVFTPLRQSFRTHLSRHTVKSKKVSRNDMCTVCELLSKAYNEGVTPVNIINGFRRSGLWCTSARGPEMS